MPLILAVWSARPSQALMRVLVRPHGAGPAKTADKSPVARRIIGIERGDDHLADLAVGNRIAGAWPDDLQHQMLVDDHAVARLALVGDETQFRGGIALQHRNATFAELATERSRQSGARDEAPLQRGDVLAGLDGGIEQDLQEIRRADIARRLEMRDRLDLLLGIGGTSRNDRTAERMRARFQHEAARRQMI